MLTLCTPCTPEQDQAAAMAAAEPLAPIGVQTSDENLILLVGQLRARLAATLAPGTSLWGADLLDADDPRSTHILAKCASFSNHVVAF